MESKVDWAGKQEKGIQLVCNILPRQPDLISIAGLIHVNDINLTTQIGTFPCQTSGFFCEYLYYMKLGPNCLEGEPTVHDWDTDPFKAAIPGKSP